MNFPLSARIVSRLLAASVVAATGQAAMAAEIATDPADYTPLPAGAKIGIVYYQHAKRDAYYANGARMQAPFRLDTDIGLARFVSYMKLGDYVVAPQAIVPFGRVALKTAFGPLDPVATNGVGDPMIGATIWLLNQGPRSLGLSAFASVPVGRYDGARGPVNVGENRWKGIFQAGYVTPLGRRLMLDLVAETAVYGDNEDFFGLRREQDASYSAQAHLRYMLSGGASVALSYYHDFGGATTVGGAEQHDRLNNGRWQVGYATFVTPALNLQVQAGKGGKTEYGARESARVNLRLVQVF
jgi:hypothetical protein